MDIGLCMGIICNPCMGSMSFGLRASNPPATSGACHAKGTVMGSQHREPESKKPGSCLLLCLFFHLDAQGTSELLITGSRILLTSRVSYIRPVGGTITMVLSPALSKAP